MVVEFNKLETKVVSSIKLAHVVLRTNRLDKMGDFYVLQVLNLISFLTFDEEHHRVCMVVIPDIKTKDRHTNGLEHIAFTFSTLSDLLLAYRQRQSRGIEPFWSTTHDPSTSIYYKDPDGNLLETQYDNFETNEEATAFITGPRYKKTPIGVDFDLEDLIKRVKADESLESLVKRPDIGAERYWFGSRIGFLSRIFW